MKWSGNVIEVGSTDVAAIKAIKARLNDLTGSTLDVNNGTFGESTKAAVEAFQKSKQLLKDGVVGELTWERLFTESTLLNEESSSLLLMVLKIAKSQLFVREKTNHNDGIEVEKYLKSVGLGAGYSWCMAFVYYVFSLAASTLKVNNPVPKTAGVLDCLAKARKYVVTDPQPGDQFIMDFGSGQGHTGFVIEVRPGGRVFTVEGNTSADPAYAGEDREGNGVYERNRPIGSMKFIRYV